MNAAIEESTLGLRKSGLLPHDAFVLYLRYTTLAGLEQWWGLTAAAKARIAAIRDIDAIRDQKLDAPRAFLESAVRSAAGAGRRGMVLCARAGKAALGGGGVVVGRCILGLALLPGFAHTVGRP